MECQIMALRHKFKISSRFLLIVRNYSESSSLWDYFRSDKKKEVPKPPLERCRKRKQNERECPDPDLSRFQGTPYRTCGSAYVIQKDVIPSMVANEKEEDIILKKIEADLTNKENVNDPMPPFRTVEQRLIDLNERRLHPFYKKYMSLPKKIFVQQKPPEQQYQCKNGPIEPEELPGNLKVNTELLEKKNIFADFKKVELPKQMVVKIVEINQNRRPTLENKNKK